MGYEPGTTFDVRNGATLGRADGADILDRRPVRVLGAREHLRPR